jgi:para-nitrobenzyl esterase
MRSGQERRLPVPGCVQALRLVLPALLASLATAACGDPAPTTPSTVVHVDSGDLAGVRDGEVSAFKGVPFAAPPVGGLRWRPPAAPQPWTGVRDASRYGDICMQNPQAWDSTASKQPVSEDCLTLNVWTPASLGAAPTDHGLPVMVWIHGGGLVSGSGAAPIFAGTSLARRGVVVVTFNYRLGRFGFFAHPALTRESPDGPLGDYGLMDQIAVLQWVRRNIAAFGGDPADVTIFGESSGGESVNRLMLSPAARGLFAKAIAESGGGRNPWKPLQAAETVGKAFAVRAGVTADDPAALRAIPAAAVLGRIDMLTNEAETYSGPILDGHIAVEDVAQGFAAGRQAKVPYIIGSNSDELGAVPAFALTPMTEKAAAVLGADKPAVIAAYGSPDAFHARFASDLNFTEPARTLAASASAAQPTFLYRFGYVATAARKSGHGAGHASELGFVFDDPGTSDAADHAAADLMGAYWTNFAKHGDPNGAGLPIWPAYAPASDRMLAITLTGAETARAGSPALDAITSHYGQH